MGASYETIVSVLENKGIHISELSKEDTYQAFINSYDKVKYGNKNPVYIRLGFTSGSEQRLFEVELIFNLIYGDKISDIVDTITRDCGVPPNVAGGGKYVWEKDGVEVKVSVDNKKNKIYVVYNNTVVKGD